MSTDRDDRESGASPFPSGPIVTEDDPVAVDLAALTEHIRSALGRHGWLHAAQRLSVADFEAIASPARPDRAPYRHRG